MPQLLIHYVTDQQVSVIVRNDRLAMTRDDHGWWWIDLDTPVHPLPYSYLIHTESGEALDHDRTPRVFDGSSTVVDRWMAYDPVTRARRSALFTKARARHYPQDPSPQTGRVTFRLLEPNLGADTSLIVTGDTAELGNWNPDAGVEMTPNPYPWWTGSVDMPGGDYEYKYIIDSADVSEWEQGPDRYVRIPHEGPVRVDDEGLMHHPGWIGAGVAIPVFALRTERSIGVGQFTDLMPFVDWAADAGFSVVQLLPINDTRKTDDWADSYPYDPVSVFALHPMYVDLEAIDGADTLAGDIAAVRDRLNPLPEIAYDEVISEKLRMLRSLFARSDPDDSSLADFIDAEWTWLGPYSAWHTLRKIHGTADMTRWGADGRFDQATVDALATGDHADEMRFHWWSQYHLRTQLGNVVEHARNRGIALKGDLAIGVAPHSVEVWQHPDIFHLDGQAGAPPDDFAVRGQNWGFPTYDWGAMSGDGYSWWRNRFAAMADAMDAYRIDHVLGFFRIWEIPTHAIDGLLGHFRPCLPLSANEIEERLGVRSIARLLRPTIDTGILERRFGAEAELVRETFLAGTKDDLFFPAEYHTQADIVTAVEGGLLDDLDTARRRNVLRGVLDLAADVPLLEIEGGYHPRISWNDTETYHRLEEHVRSAFDTLAIDFMHHRHADMWERRGRRTLGAIIDATNMLACGEDLGMVPAVVPGVMHELGLLSLEIERMPKRLGEVRADVSTAPYLSVVSPSTHDTSTLRMWWEEDPAASARYWLEVLGGEGSPPSVATSQVIEAILRRHLQSPAMLSIAPLSDWLGIDDTLRRPDEEIAMERINEPADRHHRWRYRMHLSVEELTNADGFTDRLAALLEAAGR